LRAIRAVVTSSGLALQRYGLKVNRSINEDALYLLRFILEEAVKSGTAKNLSTLLPGDLVVAGKTGTTTVGLRGSAGNMLR